MKTFKIVMYLCTLNYNSIPIKEMFLNLVVNMHNNPTCYM